MNIRKICLCLAVSAVCTTLAAQETALHTNSDRLFDEGRTLYEQRKFGASTTCFENFCATTDRNNPRYADARYYIASNAYELKHKNAQTLLQNYLNDYPDAPMRERVAYMIGRCCFEAKKYEETIAWYEQVQNNHLNGAENMAYLYTKAFAYLQLKKYEPARILFATLNGKKTIYEKDALYYYSYTEFCLENYDKAIDGFLELSLNSAYAEPAAYHALQIYDRVGDNDKACEYGKTLISRWPNSKYNSEAYRILGEAAYRTENYSEAVDYLKKYERNGQKVQRADMYMLGIAQYKQGNFREAVSALSKVTATSDSLAQNAYLHIGLSYAQYGDKTQARMAFRNAANANFDDRIKEEADYNYVLAVYEDAAPFGEAVKAFENFIETYPNTKHADDIYGYLADIYMTEKDYKTAYESLKKVKSVNPKIKAAKENVLFQLGTAEFAAKNYRGALDYFTLSIAEFTQESFSAQAFLWRGETYYRLGDYANARNDLQAFLNKNQKKSAVELQKTYYTMAYCYYEEEKFGEAIGWYQKYADTQKRHDGRLYCDALNRIGDCYFYSRDFEKAKTYYQKAATESPRYGDYAAFQNAFILGIQKKYADKVAALEQLLANYPRSDYADDAMYEIGRSYVLMEAHEQAIVAYNRVIAQFPHTAVARKASLEIGMIYANNGDNDNAIAAYKEVVNNYPSSEEAKVAIESMQAIYVDNNQINEYLAYRESIAGSAISTVKKSLEDSLNFAAAERLYVKAQYKEATTSFKNYLTNYCDQQTLNCIAAQYYLAESYYQTGLKESALEYFERLTHFVGNQYQEEALIRCAEITYDQKNYEKSLGYFEQLQETASNKENKYTARIGALRCSYALNLYNKTILAANDLLEDANANAAIIREARYCRAKSYIATDEALLATDDLQELSQDLRHEMGAEAKYLYAQQLYNAGQYTTAESEIMDFIGKNTPHQYWLARAFVLLADIYMQTGDDFQAKQYLLSLQANYQADDDIATMIEARLRTIAEREENEIDE